MIILIKNWIEISHLITIIGKTNLIKYNLKRDIFALC